MNKVYKSAGYVIILFLVSLLCIFLNKCDKAVQEERLNYMYRKDDADIRLIAQVLYNECRFLPKLDQSAVVWVILNRVDSEERYMPNTIKEVVTQPNQFAYFSNAPVMADLYILAADVVDRWQREKAGETNVGRTLPKDYYFFWGDGRKNYFTKTYRAAEYWDWSLPNPYKEVKE